MRIVSLAPSNTEILSALGCMDEVVANTRFCDYPNEAKAKPKIGGWLDINDKLVKRYEPDVVMTSTFVQDKIVERYNDMGIKLVHSDPKTLDDVYESIITVGKAVNKELSSKFVVEKMKKELAEIEELAKNRPKVKVYCEEWHKPPTVSGNWVPRIIEIAGGVSLCPEGKISCPVSPEEVKEFNPDCIVLSLCGFGDKADISIITERKGWAGIKAVKKRKIFVIDDSLLNRPGPRLVEGARVLAEIFGRL